MAIQPEEAKFRAGIAHGKRPPVFTTMELFGMVPGMDGQREEVIAMHEPQRREVEPDCPGAFDERNVMLLDLGVAAKDIHAVAGLE